MPHLLNSPNKFMPLVFVAGGRISLIGDTMRDIRTSADIIARYKTYDPGAFTYADSLGRDGEYETLIDDLFYKHNRTLKTDMQLVLRSFVSRLLLGEKEVNSDEV